MALRSRGRKLSFDILAAGFDDVMSTAAAAFSRSNSDPPALQNDSASSSPRKRKKKKKQKSRTEKNLLDSSAIPEYSASESPAINGDMNYSCSTSTITEAAVAPDVESERNRNRTAFTVTLASPFGELRQRNVGNAVNGGSAEMASEECRISKKDGNAKEEIAEKWTAGKEINAEQRGKEINAEQQRVELKGRKLEKEGTLDWKKLMAEDPNYTLPLEKSPWQYFMEEMYAGNSLRSTTVLANEKERERVYDTIFRLPWRCELLINFGFFVCFDSFLSLLTIMPTRIIMTLWRLLKIRQFKRLSSAELSDFGCFVVLVSGITVLQQADISLIYHMIRGQGIIKLYVVYNILEAITLSTCIVAHNNALFAMLVSNNFAEIKSNVFKRYSRDNVRSMVYLDSVERFHISAYILFVLAQNILEAEGPWLGSFLSNALVVYICEVMIDIIKHSFIAKFNDIKPIAFSEFLEDLCKQVPS
ncbi:protein pollen defective in guidance 1 [Phtheirospermum japonicum]|uniref:Protein pollen defective in guidance 1 n=1 Tax=Phtheirospermum japonicum TaxID=374723 RepID=A0A830BC04_9LAMI|nr:protein pollen defective in guidance 1 [Phtheirospermum japonicum]